MNTYSLNLFSKEVRAFVNDNWWLFLLFVLCLYIIYTTETGSIFEIFIIFFFHFIADIFMMMMSDAYADKKYLFGGLFQLFASIIFLLLSFYSGIFHTERQYLFGQLAFLLAGFKNLLKFSFGKNIKIINSYFIVVINLILFSLFYYYNLAVDIAVWIQLIGFVLFPAGLVNSNEKASYIMSLIGVFFISFGSFIFLVKSFYAQEISGMTVSYFLMAFVVFLYFFKSWGKYFNEN